MLLAFYERLIQFILMCIKISVDSDVISNIMQVEISGGLERDTLPPPPPDLGHCKCYWRAVHKVYSYYTLVNAGGGGFDSWPSHPSR